MMRQLRLVTLCAALAVFALAATAALANRQTVRDARAETKALKKNGRLDIIRATAGHQGELLKHVVTMRRRVDPDRPKERPLIGLNARGGPHSDPEFLVFGADVFKVRAGKDPKRVGAAELSSRGRRWAYLFDPAQIDLKRYGWAAIATRGKTFDVAPAGRYKNHRV